MPDQTAEERANEVAQPYKDYFDETQEEAIRAREDNPERGETEEEYYARIQRARASGIFGDTDTTAGASASGTDVVSADNEAATVAVAEVDAAQEAGVEGDDGVVADATDAEARRQVDVGAGTTADAETVTENADEPNGGTPEDERVAAIYAAESAEEVDSIVGDDATEEVQSAAAKQKERLAS